MQRTAEHVRFGLIFLFFIGQNSLTLTIRDPGMFRNTIGRILWQIF